MEIGQPDGAARRTYPLRPEHVGALVCRESCREYARLLPHSCILRRASSRRHGLECNLLARVHYSGCQWWHLWVDRSMHFREFFS